MSLVMFLRVDNVVFCGLLIVILSILQYLCNMKCRFIFRLIGIISLLVVGIDIQAQQNVALCSDKPRLVLILMVDNLNNEQLEIVRSRCGKDGFNRIFNHGTQFAGAYYDAGGNYAGKNLATFFTGAPASVHGIVGEQWVDNFSNTKLHAIYGDAYNHAGLLDTAAVPHNGLLLCSTIGNEIRKIYNMESKIFSVGFDLNRLLWTSGTNVVEQAAWYDVKSGKMSLLIPDTLRTWVTEFNSKGLSDIYLDKIWEPKNEYADYHQVRYFSESDSMPSFYHTLRMPYGSKSKYQRIAGSPWGNTLMRDFAVATMVYENMGQDDVPDVLMVEFSATPSCGSKKQPLDAETEDMLLNLDENIGSLLKFIDHDIGMDNTLVVFTSSQGAYDVANTESEHWKSRGAVSLHRATALLNLYLMALHGQGQWVRNYKSGEIYLDKNLCKERGVDWDTILKQSADFLLEVKGIGTAVVAKDVMSYYSDSPIIEVMRRNYHPRRSGDILICLEPGWAEEQPDGRQLTQLWGHEFVPLCFYGWKVPRATVYERHSMVEVAPTICSFIRVNKPNGSNGTLLPVVK